MYSPHLFSGIISEMLSGTFNNFLSSESDILDTFSNAEMNAHQLILLTFRF